MASLVPSEDTEFKDSRGRSERNINVSLREAQFLSY